jgi:hypothetical protein
VKSITVDNATIICNEMMFCDAADLLADMGAILAPAAGRGQGDAIAMAASEFMGGKLSSFLLRLLSTTTVIVQDQKSIKIEINSKDALNRAFTGRQRLAPSAVKLALEVNFAGFLDGLALIGLRIPTIATPSNSEDSSQSTDATG